MNSYLIVHHPYRTLQDLTSVMGLTQEEANTSWCVINDSYLTDLPLLYPPHIIALTAIFLSVTLKPSHTGALPTLSVHASMNSTGVAAIAAAAGKSGNGNSSNTGTGPQTRTDKLIEWYAESGVDMEAIIDCTQELISLYEVWETYSEKLCKEQLGRMIRQRGLS